MDKKLKINHGAVWTAGILIQLLPMLWYDIIFLDIRWMELNDFTVDDFTEVNTIGFVLAFSAAIAMSYMVAWIFQQLQVDNVMRGLKLAFMLWFSLLFLEVATQNSFSLRPFELTLIDEVLILVKYEVVAVILTMWKKYEIDA